MAEGYGQEPGADTGLRRDGAALAARVAAARRDPSAVLLEGVHTLKHALRFGAEVRLVVTPDRAAAARLLAELAPDVTLPDHTVEVAADLWRTLVARELPSPVLAVAARAPGDAATTLSAGGRLVVLERPRHLGNLGAAVRVAAAADAAGVLVVGDADPWHPTAVRAAAGLQFALPVGRVDRLPATDRRIVALDPDGTDLAPGVLGDDTVLLVGTERAGLSPALRTRADARVRIPMRDGVSSLNLATAVAAALYAGR
jgi:RNA methyltransferase, TrmH family